MKIVDKGVLDASFMDFSTPSEFARSALYYCPQFGHFYCKQGYDIQREYLELYLPHVYLQRNHDDRSEWQKRDSGQQSDCAH